MKNFLAFLFCMAPVASAQADPVTYAGKIGSADIVVELTDDPSHDGPLAGRYFYRTKGVDIPLDAKSHKGNRIELSEEGPCSEQTCPDGAPQIAATWQLSTKDKGKTLQGRWKGRKTIGIELTRIASRPAGNDPVATPYDLYNFTDLNFYDDTMPITLKSSPYDFMKFDMAVQESQPEGWPDAKFRYVVDPRTKFRSPRIAELAGSVSADAANEVLKHRHWRTSASALNCAALAYAGFFEDGKYADYGGGSLGGYEDSSSEVIALTPKLMSWTEGGSLFCGGAHPDNYFNTYVMDVVHAKLLGLGDVFTDTVDGKPGEKLIAFVKQRREKSASQTDADFDAECGMDDLISDYLSAGFKRTDDGLRILFGLQGLPHAIQACGDDLLELPAADAQDLYKPEFAKLLAP